MKSSYSANERDRYSYMDAREMAEDRAERCGRPWFVVGPYLAAEGNQGDERFYPIEADRFRPSSENLYLIFRVIYPKGWRYIPKRGRR